MVIALLALSITTACVGPDNNNDRTPVDDNIEQQNNNMNRNMDRNNNNINRENNRNNGNLNRDQINNDDGMFEDDNIVR